MPKLKINPQALLAGNPRQLLLAHGEKIGLLIVGLLALLFMWWGVSRPGLEAGHRPSDLEAGAGSAQQHFANVTWDTFPLEGGEVVRKLADAARINPRAAAQIDTEQYRPANAYFDPLIFQTRTKRTDPELLPIEQPQVAAGFAAFSLGQEEGDLRPRISPPALQSLEEERGARQAPSEKRIPEKLDEWFGEGGVRTAQRTQGVYWAAVTALVPRMKQQAKYDEALADAVGYHPAADRPVYLGFQYQRRELSAGASLQAEEGWGDPVDINQKVIRDAIADWRTSYEASSRDAEREFLHMHLTWPLGPRVVGQWGDAMLHPEVPRERQHEFGGRGGGRFEEEEAESDRDQEMMLDEFEGLRPGADTSLPPHFLLRLLDLTVEPGRRYQYRIRLKLHDVNHSYRTVRSVHELARPGSGNQRVTDESEFGDALQQSGRVPLKDLSSETYQRVSTYADDEEDFHLYGPWSEPTASVGVPFGEQQWVGPAGPPRWGEPNAALLHEQPDPTTGAPIVGSTEVFRGTLLNFKQTVYVLNLQEGNMVREEDHHFPGRTMVLDVRGGERMSGGLIAPAEVLLIDPLGNFKVLDGVQDSTAFAAWQEGISEPQQVRTEPELLDEEEGRLEEEER